MKQITLALLLSLSIVIAQSQNFVEIGSGTVSTGYPVYGSWNYAWYSVIYTQAEIGSAKQITKIAFNCINGPKNHNNQKIYMKHTSNTVFSDASYENPTNTGYTLVYDGPISYNGWTEIVLSTPFDYNGTDNLIIHYENRHGSSTYVQFNSTSSSINNNKSKGDDNSFPTSSGWLNPYPSSRPNVRFYYTAGSNPCTPDAEYPQNSAIKVSITPTLSFTLGCNTTSYDLYFGPTSTGMQLVLNNVVITDPGTYSWQPSEMLQPKTSYSWKVVAKNGSSSTESPVFTFTTEGVISNFPYFNGFEDNEVWTPGWYGTLDFTDWYYMPSPINWNRSSELNAYEGTAAAYISMNVTGSWPLVTPRILLGNNKVIKFWWRNNSVITNNKVASYDTTFFQISQNGGQDWETLGVLAPETPNEWTLAMFNLSPYAGNNVKLRWLHSINSTGGNKAFFLDNIRIEDITYTPEIVLSTTSYNFGDLCQNGITTFTLGITNQGSGNLEITGISVDAPFYSTYTGTIAPGATDYATIVFDATAMAVSTYNKIATLNINGQFVGGNTISLTGMVIAPLQEIYETFETTPVNTIPIGWKKFRTSDPNEQFNDVLVKNGTQYDYHSPVRVLKFLNANDSISLLAIVLPGVTNFNTHQLSFWATKNTGDPTPLALIVGLTNDPYNPEAMDTIQVIPVADQVTQYTATFAPNNTKPYIVIAHNNALKWRSIYVDDIAWQDPNTNTVPNPAQNVYPAHNATNTDVMSGLNLKWANGGGNPTGYRLSVGTNNPPSNIVNNIDLGDNVGYFMNREQLPYGATIYWQVVPYNNFGDAVNCPIWSFTVMEDPTIFTFPWIESFENVNTTSGFDYPLGWSLENGAEQFVCWDVISNTGTVTDNAYHGQKAMHNTFGFISQLNDWLFTPPVFLEANKTYKFSFYTKVKRFQGETSEALAVKWGTNNSSSAMSVQPLFSNSNMTDETYTLKEFQVTPSASGQYFFGFHSFSQPLQFLTYIDYVTIDLVTGQEHNNVSDIKIYPNPSSDRVWISGNEIIEEVSLVDVAGKVRLKQTPFLNKTSIDISSLTNGIYFIKINTSKGMLNLKVTKN